MVHIESLSDMLNSNEESVWHKKLFSIANDHGFEQTLFALVPTRHTNLEKAFLRSNYAASWRKVYDIGKFLDFDPTVAHCISSALPLIWSPEIFVTPQQKQMYEEASGYGLRSGITLPIHGGGRRVRYSLFCDGHASWQTVSSENKTLLAGVGINSGLCIGIFNAVCKV
ncbi:autoinducer binding domain-containing protein [Sulfuricella sp.]|uniref:autoinducer binding domain-containing protein n=1 Tax=Sulfuricella sp. TaxID=2099377 RepID=UPI002BC93343|nr:autoinducer binding domain-containing protein [Sulfuricella sp.]HUX63537.1 autoinducer binding domain-containing protein [Sulfuricella sp.]